MSKLIKSGTTLLKSGAQILGSNLINKADLWSLPNTQIVYDISSEVGYADGDAVQNPTDWSGNGFATTQTTGANKALYKTNIQNGLPALLFDGTNDFYDITPLSLHKNVAGFTAHVAYKRTGGTGTQCILNLIDNTTNSRINIFPYVTTTLNGQFAGRRIDGETASNNNTWSVSAANPHILSFTWDYATGLLKVYSEGTLLTTVSAFSTGAANSNTNSAGITLGSSNASLFFNGYLFEMSIANSAHSLSDVLKAQTYLKKKWGI